MKSKCERALKTVSSLYSSSESLTYDDFCTVLGTVAAENDIYFYVEAMDNSFYISSVDDLGLGRPFKGSRELMDEAKLDLVFGSNELVSVSASDKSNRQETIVYATASKGKGMAPIYIYAVTSLTPIGPAIGIMRSLLLIVTFVSLALAMIISIVLSRRLSDPIIKMNNKAKELAGGNYDVTFEGGHKFREMDQLADTLTEAAVDLKKSDALQKDLMANVSHDLRTPLTMIKSYAEMIRDLSGDNPAKRDEHLGVIIGETDRLSDLVNDVLTLSKMQSGVTELEYSEFDIQKAARSVLSTFLVLEHEGYS
ncbi:MAG: HAMP domain-containing histidine kinase, partial [Clostridia bacterium]|nr:HAMP domain-containing histidine kinase [Clostridia bacterium]